MKLEKAGVLITAGSLVAHFRLVHEPACRNCSPFGGAVRMQVPSTGRAFGGG